MIGMTVRTDVSCDKSINDSKLSPIFEGDSFFRLLDFAIK